MKKLLAVLLIALASVSVADLKKIKDGGDVRNIAVDDVDGLLYQMFKPVTGLDGSADGVSFKNALPVTVGGGSGTDAFGRMRVSNPVTLFESRTEYDKEPLVWGDTVVATASAIHDANNSAVTLTVGTDANDSLIRQTFEFFRYHPGKSQLVLISFGLGDMEDNNRVRIGYFETNNGIYFENKGTTPKIVLRSKVAGSVVNTEFTQANWSVDIFDGSGASGIDLDFTKSQILFIDLEWLAVGRVRVGFVVDGYIIVAHEFLNANVVAASYMTTANLPIRYELTNVDGGAADSISAICSTVISEGGKVREGFSFTASNGVTPIAVTTRRPILSIRLKGTFNSIINRGQIVLEDFLTTTATNDCLIEVVYGGTLTGASFASVGASSITEFDIAATAISGGITIHSFPGISGQGSRSELGGADFRHKVPLTLDMAGANPFNLSVVITPVTGTSNNKAYFNWFEIR